MVKIDIDNSITVIKNDSNFVMFRCLNHFEEVNRVVFNLLDNSNNEVFRKELSFEGGIIPFEIDVNNLNAGKYKYNLKMCFKTGQALTLIREKEFIILEDYIRC